MQTALTDHVRHHTCWVDPSFRIVDGQQPARAQLAHLLIRGMKYPSCAMRVRNALLGADGVQSADVLLQRGVAVVRYDPAQIDLEDLPDILATAGDSSRNQYTARILE